MADGILDRLVENSRESIRDGTYELGADHGDSGRSLAGAVRDGRGRAILSEIKFASPSRGQIRAWEDPARIAAQMVAGGATGISVLTQPRLFGGSPEHLASARSKVGVPILMKDIVVDPVQVDAAGRLGADYILLIQSLFDRGLADGMDRLVRRAHGLGLGVLVEAHTPAEFDGALGTGADIIGINNRNLDTMEIDLGATCKILEGRQKDRPVLSESGISGPDDVRYLRGCGADGFLVGSGIMDGGDIESQTRRLAEA